MRRPFREDEQMVQLWARRMLGLTRLPIFIMHTGNVDVDAILGTVDDGARRLRLFPVHIIPMSSVGSMIWYYRDMYTKLHAWTLPCQRVAYLDYDGLPLRSLDGIFAACGEAEFCAVRDRIMPSSVWGVFRTIFNAGVLVLRPSQAVFEEMLHEAVREGAQYKYAEQGYLNRRFSNWTELPRGYNIPYYAIRRWPKDPEAVAEVQSQSSFFYHDKLWRMPPDLVDMVLNGSLT